MLYFSAMMRLFKTWLILILMVLLPLQAVAAEIRMACANGQQQAARGLPADTAAAPCHQARETPLAADAHGERHAACGACAAFCLGAFMPASFGTGLPDGSCAEDVTVTETPPPAGFIPDGPRRPPRHA